MKKTKRYSRKTTGVTISIFYEHYQLKKYNFDAPYQRDYNVWDLNQKSFLIDTIMKNFPIPPIFLEQKINSTNGKTTYDVIDGKQRLTAIIDFIENKIKLPIIFSKDDYGNEDMDGKSFDELKMIGETNEEVQEFISNFWSYIISVEYIENPDTKIVDNIFDRLNRGGERLNHQELRKANYYDTIVYYQINSLREHKYLSQMLCKLKKNRLEDMSFITELYLLVWCGKIIDGIEDKIDEYFETAVEEIGENEANRIISTFNNVEHIVQKLNLDYEKYRITGVSHLYAIWYLAYYMFLNDIEVNESIIEKINEFYTELRGDRKNQNTIKYHQSMQSASKYKSSRKKRIMALLDYFEFDYNEKDL